MRQAELGGLDRARRTDRAHLGHAPGVPHLDAVVVLERADHLGRARRTADSDELQRRQSLALLAQVLQQAQPDSRHGRGHRHLLGFEDVVDRGAVELGSRHDHAGSAHQAGQRQTPGIGVEHRHDRKHRIIGVQRQDLGPGRHHRVQDVRTVRVEHPLRVAGGAGGVAKARRRALVEFGPLEVGVRLGDPFLVRDGILEPRRRHVSGVGQDDVALDGRQVAGDRLEQRHEGQIGHDDPVLGVVDDPGDLFGKEAGIDGVIDRAEAGDAVPGLEVAVAVPGQGGHAVAELDPVALQTFGDLERPFADLGVGRPVHRTLDRPRRDLLVRKLDGREVDDLVHQQRPFLHPSEHCASSLNHERDGLIAALRLFMSIL